MLFPFRVAIVGRNLEIVMCPHVGGESIEGQLVNGKISIQVIIKIRTTATKAATIGLRVSNVSKSL
jgi:hypothetical protein